MVQLHCLACNLVARVFGDRKQLRRRHHLLALFTICNFAVALIGRSTFVDAQDSNALVRVEVILRPDKNWDLEKSPSVMSGAVWLNDAQLLQEDVELKSILEFTPKQHAKFNSFYNEYRTVVAAEYPGAVRDAITVQKAVQWLGERQTELTAILTVPQQEQFHNATRRYLLRQLGLVRGLRTSNSEIQLTRDQRVELQKCLVKLRQTIKERRDTFYSEHTTELTKIFEAGQIREYTEQFQEFVAGHNVAVELLAFQLSLKGDEAFIRETRAKSLNAFHLPSNFALLPSGRLNVRWSLDVSSDQAPLASMWLLMDPKMITRLELSENQIDEAKNIAEQFQRENARIKAKRPLMSSADFSDDPKIFLERSRQSEQAMKRYNSEVVAPFYRSIEKSIAEVLIPQQKRQLADTILQVEIQRLGLSAALAFGELGNRLKITERQRDWLVKWRATQLEKCLEMMRECEEQVLAEIAEIIGPDQEENWTKQIGTPDAKIWPAPTLLLTEPIVDY